MATKSFLKNINITTVKQAHKLVEALEKAEKYHGEPVKMQRSASEVTPEELDDFISKIRI
jgi:hypothetical protein